MKRLLDGAKRLPVSRRSNLGLPVLSLRKLPPKWLPLRWFAIKYMIAGRTALKWIRGQGKDCYRLQVVKTPAGLRILDPQLELPPHRTAPASEMFIYRASEIAALAGVSKQWVNKLAKQHRLRSRFYGHVRYFPVSEARRLIDARRMFSKTTNN